MTLDKLKSTLSEPDSLLLSGDRVAPYAHDETHFSVTPSGVLIAKNTDDIITSIKFCRENKIPITARGAGTGLSGGCVPTPGSLVITLEDLKKLGPNPMQQHWAI